MKMNFMSGETHLKVEHLTGNVYCDWFSDSDTMAILLQVEVMKRKGIEPNNLYIPYLPYARQDRVINDMEPFSLKVFASLINPCGFKKVVTHDVHSKEAFKHINKLASKVLVEDILSVMFEDEVDFLVCPDNGAVERVKSINEREGIPTPIIYATKVRENGKIIQTTVKIEDIVRINEKNILISDDCIAGGRTFIELAKVLRVGKPNKLSLVVTHIDDPDKINSELYTLFDRVYHCDDRRKLLSGSRLVYVGNLKEVKI